MSKKPSAVLGHVVVPARNGYLAQLGYDIEALDTKALGVVVDEASRRALVSFPEIGVTLWLDVGEFADVDDRVAQGDRDYVGLLPEDEDLESGSLVWILSYLIKELPIVQVLSVDSGDLVELWDPADEENIEDFLSEDLADQKCCRVALGLSSFGPQLKKLIEEKLKKRLMFTQLKPAGMHKFEVSFYLRR